MNALIVTIFCVLTPVGHGQGLQTPGPKGNDPASVIIAIPPPPGVNSYKNRILVLPSSNSIVRWAGNSRGAVAVDQPGSSIARPTGNPVQLKDAFVARPSTDWASGQNPIQGSPNISQGKIPVFWHQSSVIQNGKRPDPLDASNKRIVTSDKSGTSGNSPSQGDVGNYRQGLRATSQQEQSTQQQASQNGLQKRGENPSQQGQQNSAQQQQSLNTAQQNSAHQEGTHTRNQPSSNTGQQQGWRNIGVQRPAETPLQQRETGNTRVVNKPNTQPPTRVDSGSIFFNPDSPTNGPANNPAGPSGRPLRRNTGPINRSPVQTVAETPTVVRNRPGFVPAARVFVPQQTSSATNHQTLPSSKINNNQPPSRSVSQTDRQPVKPPPAPVDTPIIRNRPNAVVSGKIEYTGKANARSDPSVAVDRGSTTGNQQTNQNQQPQPNVEPQPTKQKSPSPVVNNQHDSRAGPSALRSIYGNGGRPTNQNPGPVQDGQNWNQAANQATRPAEQPSLNRAGNQRFGVAPFPQVPTTSQGQIHPTLRQSRPTERLNPASPNTADSGRGNPPQRVISFPNNFAANNNAGNQATGNPGFNTGATGRRPSAVNPLQPVFPQMNPEVNPNQAQLNTNGYPQNNRGMNTPGTSVQLGSIPNSFPAGMDIQLILNRIASQYEQARRNQLRSSNTNPISLNELNRGVGAQNPNGIPGINLLGERNNAGGGNGNTPQGGVPVNPIVNNPGPITRSRDNLPQPGGQQFPHFFPQQQSILPGSQSASAQAIPPAWTARPIPPSRQTNSPNSQSATGMTFRPNTLRASVPGGGLPPNNRNGPMFGQSWPVDAAGNRGTAQQPGFFPNQPANRNGMLLPALPANPPVLNLPTTTPEPTEAPEIELEPTPNPTPIPSIWQRLGFRPNSQGASGSGQTQPGLPNVPFWNNRQQTPVPRLDRTAQPRPNQFFPQRPRDRQQTPLPNYRQGFQPLAAEGQTSLRNNVAQNQPFPLNSLQFRNRNANGTPNQAGPLANSGANSSNQNKINRQSQNPLAENSSNQPNNSGGGPPRRVQPAWRPPTGAGQKQSGQIGAGQRQPNQIGTRQRPPSQTGFEQRPSSQTGAEQKPPNQTGAGQRVQTQVPNTLNQQNAKPKPPVRLTPENQNIQRAWVPPSRSRVPQIQPPLFGTARNRLNGQQTNRGNTPPPNRGQQQRGRSSGGQGHSNSSAGVIRQGQTPNANPMFHGMNPSLLALLNRQRNSQSGGTNPAFPGMPNGMSPQMVGMALLRRYQDQPCGPSKVLHQQYQKQYMRYMAAQQQRRQAQMAMFQAQSAARSGTAGAVGQSPNPMQQNPFMSAGNMSQQSPFMPSAGNMAALAGMMPLTPPESPEINYQCTVSESCGMTNQERLSTIHRAPEAEVDCQSQYTGLLCCLG